MKFLMAVAVMLLSAEVRAVDYEKPPKGLEDGEYTFKLKSGKAHKFNSNEWKIVPRIKHAKKAYVAPICEPVVEIEEVEVEKEVIVEVEVEVEKKVKVYVYTPNRISLVLGYGPIGLEVDSTDDGEKSYTVVERMGPVLGARYVYTFSSNVSAGASYLTSNTILGSVGYGW